MDEAARILLVEDEPAHAELILRAFEAASPRHPVTAVGSLAEARKHLAGNRPGLIIADWRLPDGDGLELLPGPAARASVPVILMTSHGNERVAVEAMQAGALDYVVKSTEILSDMPHLAGRALDIWRSREELRESEQTIRSIFLAAPVGIGVVVSRVLRQANDRLCSMTGYSRAELLGQSSRILYPTDEDFEYVGREKYRQIGLLGTGTVETRWRRKDGVVINVLLSSSPLDPADLTRGVTFTALDITDRVRSEAALRSERDLTESMFRTAPVIILMLDADGRIVTFNPFMQELCGYRPEEVRGRDWFEIFLPPDCRDRVRATFADVLSSGGITGSCNPVSTRNGRERLIEWHSRPLRGPAGETVGVLAVGMDITDRRRAEEEIRSLARIPEESPHPVLRIAGDGRILYANAASTPLLTGVMAGRSSADGFLPELAAEAIAGQTNKMAEIEADGRVYEVILSPVPEEAGPGAPPAGADRSSRRVNVYGRDITDRRRLQIEQREYARRLEREVAERTAEIRLSEERYRALFENVDHAIVTTDLDGAVVSANPAARKLFAWDSGQHLGGSLAEHLDGQDGPDGALALARARSGTALSRECLARAADGREMPLHLSVSPLRGADGRPSALIWVMTDLSERERLAEEVHRVQEYAGIVLRRAGPGSELVGSGEAHRHIVGFIRSAASADAPVLILGESGAGKEVVARSIHLNSPRSAQPFIVTDCAALTGSLLESELFGHEKGAFTGAAEAKAGLVEIASGGTLFVDEVGEMPLELQSKLLRVLERGEFRRVGSVRERRADLRVVAATNRDLSEEVRKGRFRSDLYFRLNVLSFNVPPLRERIEDVPELARYFLAHSRVTAPKPKRLRPDAMKCLQSYSWPGNVRELANVVERAVILSGTAEVLTPDHLPPELRRHAAKAPQVRAAASMADAERQAIASALQTTGGNKSKAAEILGITRATLRSKMAKFGL